MLTWEEAQSFNRLADHFDHVDAFELSGAMIRLARRQRARGEVRKLLRNLVRRDAREAWEIFELSTGPWLDHRVSDRYLSRGQFEQVYAEVFPETTFTRVGNAQAMIWDAT